MADATEPAAETPATGKWWGHSMTIWGAVITTLSTVLPAIGPLLGLDITPELARQLGDHVVLAVQAVGGLAGTILTIYGRARATTTLERRQLTLTMWTPGSGAGGPCRPSLYNCAGARPCGLTR
jgi:hypothetical protein